MPFPLSLSHGEAAIASNQLQQGRDPPRRQTLPNRRWVAPNPKSCHISRRGTCPRYGGRACGWESSRFFGIWGMPRPRQAAPAASFLAVVCCGLGLVGGSWAEGTYQLGVSCMAGKESKHSTSAHRQPSLLPFPFPFSSFMGVCLVYLAFTGWFGSWVTVSLGGFTTRQTRTREESTRRACCQKQDERVRWTSFRILEITLETTRMSDHDVLLVSPVPTASPRKAFRSP